MGIFTKRIPLRRVLAGIRSAAPNEAEDVQVTNGALHVTDGTSGSSGVRTALLTAVTSVSTGTPQNIGGVSKAIRGKVTGTGQVTATIDVYGSDENSTVAGVLLGTIALNGNDVVADGFVVNGPWIYMWGDLTEISGTGASVDLGVAH